MSLKCNHDIQKYYRNSVFCAEQKERKFFKIENRKLENSNFLSDLLFFFFKVSTINFLCNKKFKYGYLFLLNILCSEKSFEYYG